MSNRSEELRDLLDVAVRDEAYAVRFDASKAWGEGRRRRVADGLGVLVAVVVLLGVGLSVMSLVLGTTLPLSPASGSGEVAAKHPQRLDDTYWTDEQPRVTGPLAGVVERSAEDDAGWYTVSPEGRMWRLDMELGMDLEPALSPDGSHLGYIRGSWLEGHYVIANQVDGTSVSFPEIGTGGSYADHQPETTYFHSGQTPAFWSHDGDQLLLRIGRNARVGPGPHPVAGVLGTDGSFTAIPAPPGLARRGANPVGWLDDSHVALVVHNGATRRVRVWVVDVRTGQSVRSFYLEGTSEDEYFTQWFGRLSPDGSELATGTTTGMDMRFYSMRSDPPGALTDTLPAIPDADTVCSPSWTSSDLYLPTRSSDFDLGRDDGAIVVRADGEVTIVADPRLNIGCSAWARSALEGPAHKSWGSRLFGDDSNWLAWRWREVSLAAMLVLGLLAIRLAVKRGSWRARVRGGARSAVRP